MGLVCSHTCEVASGLHEIVERGAGMRQEAPIFFPLREPSARAVRTSLSLTLRIRAALAGVSNSGARRSRERRAGGRRDDGGTAGAADCAAPIGLGDLLAHRQAAPSWAAVPAKPPPSPLVDGFGHLEFDVVIEISHRRHAGTLVNGLLDLRREGDVFHDKAGNFDAIFAGDGGVDDRQEGRAQFIVARGDVEHGHWPGRRLR